MSEKQFDKALHFAIEALCEAAPVLSRLGLRDDEAWAAYSMVLRAINNFYAIRHRLRPHLPPRKRRAANDIRRAGESGGGDLGNHSLTAKGGKT